jgi:glycosyl hydrolase family 106( putative alpha-L-rhamnosidase)
MRGAKWGGLVIMGVLCCMGAGAAARGESAPDGALAWPAVTRECRPWTRWWWMGSAVDEAEITRHLEFFHEAGLGGVEISPIYGVQGAADRNVSYLSPQWVSMLHHSLREAKRQDLGVDMITGSGWPFGGPWIRPEDAAAQVVLTSIPLDAEGRPVSLPANARLQALMAFSSGGEILEITGRVDSSGKIDWTAPAGKWAVYAVQLRPTGQKVKRAAPGGEGPVLDPFAGGALHRYLEPFDQALAGLPREERLRCFFNDSFEAYGANWTADLLGQFERRRGYDLRRWLPALMGQDTPDRNSRVRSDFRQTVSDLLLEEFTRPWTEWAHRRGSLSRNQAHGSPGNLLDLYAAADIPETEVFGTAWLELAGLDPLPGTPRRYGGREEILACKLASSAAHVTGKRLCSSESMTWLGEHFKVPLEHAKAEADCLFVMGVNHLFYHGTPFSPADAAWPGWLCYASTHFGPTNPFWRDFPALNAYIARCQSFLQAGQPDNDVLLYLPIFDLWAKDRGSSGMLQPMTVHNTESWLDTNLAGFARAGRLLWDRGYGFDCVSDRLLEQAVQVSDRRLASQGGSYRVLVLAGCTLMPPETLERIVQLAREGATVIVAGDLPQDVPGLGNLEERRRRLKTALASLGPSKPLHSGITQTRLGKGRLLAGPDLERLLELAGVERESVVDEGVELIRRADEAGTTYFLANLGRKRVDRWVPLAVAARSAVLFDPMHEQRGVAAVRRSKEGGAEVYLQMDPGQALILRALRKQVSGPRWRYLEQGGPPQPIEGEWSVEFIEGGPELPKPTRIRSLTSWTEFPHDPEALKAFSGTARYRISFQKPAVRAEAWALDLGQVCHSARVRLNGRDLGTLFSRPFRLELGEALRDGRNDLEIEVTNLMANRIAEMDRRKVPWRKFYFVNIQYREFDASGWEPLPSGLLGPVQLVPYATRKIYGVNYDLTGRVLLPQFLGRALIPGSTGFIP